MHRLILAFGIVLCLTTAGCTIGFADTNTLQFTEVNPESGITYNATVSRTITAGAGVYVSDINNDLRPDVLTVGGAGDPDAPSQPALYLNTEEGFNRTALPSDDRLTNQTINAALFFDYNNDGWDDLLLLPIAAEPILFKNRQGDFEVHDVGLNMTLHVPMGATAADYDSDGDLDLLIYQNGDWMSTTPIGYQEAYSNVENDNGNPNVLFENKGNEFERVENAGIAGARWSLAASFVDLTGNSLPDIHVANDYNNDYLYVNQGNSTFTRVRAGRDTDRNGMSSEIADVNGDGRPDIFVTNIYFNESRITSTYTTNYLQNALGKRALGNNLLINQEDTMFVDRAAPYGVRTGGWGWAAVIADLDNDGDNDIVHATQEFSETFIRSSYNATDVPSYYQYPAVWEGKDNTFVQRNGATLGFNKANGRGLARFDYNRDGDLDVLTTEWEQGRYKLYENTGAKGNWLQVVLRGNRTQTPIGARVYTKVDGTNQMRVHNARADYLSQDSRTLHVGLGDSSTVDRLRVVWPDGTERVYTELDANQLVVVSIDGEIKRHATANGSPF